MNEKKIPKILKNVLQNKSKILFTDLRPLCFQGDIDKEYIIEKMEKRVEFKFNGNVNPPKIDENSKSCQIRIRLLNGKNYDVEFCTLSKISEIYDHVARLSSLKKSDFEFFYSFPLKKLENTNNQNIEDLDLENCLLRQKLIKS